MSTSEQVVKALAEVVPEVDEATLDPRRPFRQQLDMDSIDFLRFVTALSKLAGADVPERDYGKLTSVESCARYLDEHRAAGSSAQAP